MLNVFKKHKIYLQFQSFLSTAVVEVVEILRCARHGSVYTAESISWLLMTFRRQEALLCLCQGNPMVTGPVVQNVFSGHYAFMAVRVHRP